MQRSARCVRNAHAPPGAAHTIRPAKTLDAEARDVGATQAYRKRALDCHPDKQPDPKLKKGACDSPSSSERSCGC